MVIESSQSLYLDYFRETVSDDLILTYMNLCERLWFSTYFSNTLKKFHKLLPNSDLSDYGWENMKHNLHLGL